MPSSIHLHDVKEIEIKEEALYKDENGKATSIVTDIIIRSSNYGVCAIHLFPEEKNKDQPITIKRKV